MSEEEIIFKNEYLQKPISFLTQENLEKLEQHCEKTIRYATRNLLKEHQIILELIYRYKEMNKEIRNLKEKNEELNRLKGFEMLDIFNMGKESSRQRIKHDWVEKDKIREKLKEEQDRLKKGFGKMYQENLGNSATRILKELLEEE